MDKLSLADEAARIARLREGASSYEIEAKPVVENLDRLHTVFILPPLEKKP